jgi:hypothetical protein
MRHPFVVVAAVVVVVVVVLFVFVLLAELEYDSNMALFCC